MHPYLKNEVVGKADVDFQRGSEQLTFLPMSEIQTYMY